MTGQTISHYRILEKLGEGGMGVVYKAEDTKLRRTVALKFLPPHLAADEEVRRRFLHEAQTAAALSHPNICVVHEVDEDHNFLGLEYVEGETVAAKIKRRPLPLEEALDIVVQAAQGLEAAHEKQIVHRDVKSANLMVTPAGHVKVMDFGLAQLRGHSKITRTGSSLGTPAYMSPEQFRGEAVDHRTDIWSLGVVLYEMIAGAMPFAGDSDAALLYSVLNKEPEPLSARRADVSTDLDRVLKKVLAKERNQRYQHIADLLVDLKTLQTRGNATPMPARKPVRKKAVVAALLVAALAAAGIWNWRQRVRAGREKAFQEAVELYNAGQSIPAYKLAKRLDAEMPADPRTSRLWEQVGVFYSLSSDPAGADVSIRELGRADGEWIPLGKTPLVKVRVPLETNLHLLVKMEGYEVVERAGLPHFLPSVLKLAKAGSWPPGMVPIQGRDGAFLGRQAKVDDFWLDKYETTNGEFKSFVDAGGYREKGFWKHPFVEKGRQLSWEEAMKRFVDATGRPGPANWELGTHPEGQAGYPVSGVSWYEAAAFAEFAGKELPTIFHWGRAAIDTISPEILNVSNFNGKGLAPTGRYQGVSPFGVYDVAGNVKEWCWNQRGDGRYIMGRAWNEPSYSLDITDGALPFERSETMGFRCAKYNIPPAAATLEPFQRIVRDYSKENPVPDEVFRAYRSLYSYDPGPLDARVEGVDESEPSWRVERVTFSSAYGGDRMAAYLYIPRKSTPPYQTVIHFPGSYAVNLAQINNLSLLYVRYFIQSGRALVFPIFYGTYERRAKVPVSGPHAARDLTIRWSKELGRTIDYLETRRDFDSSRLVFHGFSLGAGSAVLPVLGVEGRLKFAILLGGGFPHEKRLSEVDPINFMPRARMPVLMINGRNDFAYPLETSQKPLLRFLGSPPEHKRHAVFDSGHVVPRNAMIKESLDWLDKYLGPVHLAP